MVNLRSIETRLAKLAEAMPPEQANQGWHGNSEEAARETARIVAEDDKREAALAALPAEEQAKARAEDRLEFLRGLEEDGDEARNQWADTHAEAVRVLADPLHARMVPVLRRFVEGIARMPPATAAERALLAQERRQ